MQCDKDCFNCKFPDCVNDYIKPYNAEYRKKYHIENREKENERNSQRKAENVSKGMCRDCGRPIAQNSKCYCLGCLSKVRKRSAEYRKKKGQLPKTLFDGVKLCKLCGKGKPAEGYKVCQRCLENNRTNIRKAHENRNFDPLTNSFIWEQEIHWKKRKKVE